MPVASAAELEADELAEAPLEDVSIEWTPDRAAALLRGIGYLGHIADPLHRAEHPDADELWKWSQADAVAAGEPLSRILNRYAPLRRLAGVADETELAFTLTPYVLENLARRGRIVSSLKLEQEAAPAGPFEGAEPAPPPQVVPVIVPTGEAPPPWRNG